MSDLVAALHAELAAIHNVTPGHSLTGDYAALKPDAERLAVVFEAHNEQYRAAIRADERLLRDRANKRVREVEAELDQAHAALAHATRFVYGNGRAQITVDYEPGWGHEDVPWVVRSPHPTTRHSDRDAALARAHELAQENT